MNRIIKSGLRQTVLLSLLICFCLGQTHTQTGQQYIPTAPGKPGIMAGYTIIDGDIQMPVSVVNAMRQQAGQEAAAAPEATLDTRYWPNGIVRFEFQTDCVTFNCPNAGRSGCVVDANQQQAFAAMNVIEEVSAVRFEHCPNNTCGGGSYLRIRDSSNDRDENCGDASGNSATVGRQKTGQFVNITDWGSRFVIVHELMHALGFYHEQTRVDRNQYVEVEKYCGNVKGGCMGKTYEANFKVAGFHYSYYDFDSVMHYGQCTFSVSDKCPNDPNPNLKDGGITIRVNEPFRTEWQSKIGQETHLSELDKLTLFLLYGESNWRFVDATPNFPAIQTGDLLFPYDNLATALAAVPTGGTLWLEPGTYTLPGELLSKQVRLRAPLGGVTIRRGPMGAFTSTLTSVSAASYGGELAADSIVAAFGSNLAASTAAATSLPLPTTLGGVTVRVTDREQVTHDAPLFFVSPSQINYLVPAAAKPGLAKIIVYNGERVVATSEAPINPVAPALFTANASGQGAPAAIALRVRADGSQSVEQIVRYDAAQQRIVPVPIDLGPEGDQVFLILFGTGFRARSEPEAVAAIIGDKLADVLFSGAAPGFAGLDQANVRLPRSLAGKGEVSLALMADNRSSNRVTVNIR
jgi:uncharacterized protein (TIGR03437 family)